MDCNNALKKNAIVIYTYNRKNKTTDYKDEVEDFFGIISKIQKQTDWINFCWLRW